MKQNKSNKTNSIFSKTAIYYLIIAISCFILYGQSISNNFNIDDDYVYENHKLVEQGIKGIPEILTSRYNTKDEQYFGYRPLTIAIYAVEYEIFGSNPHSAHFLNILYYIASCFLLFYLLQIIFKDKYPEQYLWISFITVLIFLSHAIHTEVVLSIKNREEIIALILSLLSAIFAFKFFESKKILPILLSVFFLSLAFLAKESAIIFIVLIPFTIIFFKTDIKILSQFKYNKINLSSISQHLKILYAILAILIVTYLVFANSMNIYNDFNLYSLSIDLGQSAFVIWGIYVLIYTYILYRRKKESNPVRITRRNIIIWSLLIMLLIPTILGHSHLLGLLILILLPISLIHQKEEPIISFRLLENVNKKLIISILLLGLISGIVLATVYYVPKKSLPEINAPVYKWQNPAFTTNSTSDKAAIAIYSIGYYSKLLVIPYPLRFYYGYNMVPNVGLFNPIVLLSLFFHLFLIIIAFKGFNKRKLFSFGILLYLFAIFPFANTFCPLTGIIAERLLFVPSIGFSIILTYIIIKISKINTSAVLSKSNRNKTLFLALIFIIPNALLSINRNPDWKDRESLYTHDIQYLENSAKANTLYANLLIGEVYHGIKTKVPINTYRAQVELAVKHFARATEIDSTYSNPWHNLGYINMIIYKNYMLAEQQFSQSIKADSTVAASYLNRGIVYYYLGNFDKSIDDLSNYINKNKNITDKEFDKAFVFSAKSYLALEDTLSATNYYILAAENLKIENLSKSVLDDIKSHFMLVKRYDQAIKISDVEISLNPNSDAPYVEKGNYYLLSGDTIKAVDNWEIAFEKFNGNFNIAMTLQQYFTSIGNIEKANYYYNTAMQYRQNNPR